MATSVSGAQAPAPILTPQVAALFAMHGSGTQEQREPPVLHCLRTVHGGLPLRQRWQNSCILNYYFVTALCGAAGGGLRLGAPPLHLLPDLSDHFDHGGTIMIAIEGRFQRMVLLMKLLELPGSLISFLVEAGQNTTLTMVLTFQIIDNLLLVIDDLLKLLEGLYIF